MKKKIIGLAVITFALAMAGCGKNTDTEIINPIEKTVETVVAEEMNDIEENLEIPHYTGYNHYTDPDTANAVLTEETEQNIVSDDNKEETDESEIDESEAEKEVNIEEQESKVEIPATPEPVVPTPEPIAESVPEPVVVQPAPVPQPVQPTSILPDCLLSDGEFYPPVSLFIIVDKVDVMNGPDANSGSQGYLTYGANIGCVGRSGDYIRVNYGASPAWVNASVMSSVDPLE